MKGWRRIGGGLEEDWRRIGGGWTTEVWSGHAPVWPGYAPVWGLCADLLEKCNFFAQIWFFKDFSFWGAQVGCKSRKATFYVFGFFTLLFRRFTLSSVAHGSKLDEIYRFISTILHFMPSGSIFENLLKIYRKSMENLSKIYRNSMHLGCIWGGS